MKRGGRPKKYFYFGLDAGNGSIKIVGDSFEERIPSYKTDSYIVDSIGSVQIDGVGYTVGRNALKTNKSKTRTVDDKYAKVQDIQSLYLGALAHYDCPSIMHNRLVVSSHAYSTLKKEIVQQLEFENLSVILAGKEVQLTTEVLLLVPEGFGAVYKNRSNIATLDFGNGTTVLTPYSRGKAGEAHIEYGGVQQLIRLISEEMARLSGGCPADVDDIRRSLERGDLRIDGGTLSIKEEYKKCLAIWWQDGLRRIVKEAVNLVEDGEQVICLGGGVALPSFSKILASKKLSPITDRPEMVNARGLYQLALIKGNANA